MVFQQKSTERIQSLPSNLQKPRRVFGLQQIDRKRFWWVTNYRHRVSRLRSSLLDRTYDF